MSPLTLDNVVAHALQAMLLAAVGTAAAKAIRIDSGAVRYGYWRVLLAACLIVPWLSFAAPAKPAPTSGGTAEIVGATSATVIEAPVRAIAATPTNWIPVVTTILFAGIAVRLLWVGAGIVSLRRLRGLGIGANDEEDIRELQEILRTNADVRYVPGLRQPATFGVRRPVVLLPDTIRGEESTIRRALVSHELFHVQRRDWIWVLCEEVVLAAFWFNPAMWWLVARVRLAREEAVDELAVLATGSRRTYVRALLAYAEDAPLAPAPAFARRRHLFHRITLISKEGAMSSFRIVCSCAVMAMVVLSGSRYAAAAFPLVDDAIAGVSGARQGIQAAGPVERRSNPITASNPIPRRTDYRPADYPAEARALEAKGMIHLRVTVDELGRVVESRRLGFTLGTSELSIGLPDASPENIAAFVERAILRTRDGRVADNQAVMRVVEAFTQAATFAVSNWRYEAPANGPIAFDVKIHFQPDGETTALQGSSAPPPSRNFAVNSAVDPLQVPTDAVRIGGMVKPPAKIRHVPPVYPSSAQSARVSGMVIIEAVIDRDGFVTNARVLRSVPELDQAAVNAVMQWVFEPTLVNGAPRPVIMTVTVNFTLQ